MIDERHQVRLLGRTFFLRLFESELMPPGLAQVQLVIWVISFLAAPAVGWPLLMSKKYFSAGDPMLLRAMMAQDRLLVIVVTMLATALITLVIWENIFPDQRDSRHLGVLPIRPRSFVFARMGALLALFLLLFLATTFLASFVFTAVQAMFGAPAGFPRAFIAHFATMSACEATVFFGILLVQCALLNLAGPDVAQRTALVAQLALVAGMLQIARFLLPASAFVAIDGVPGWATMDAVVYAPPYWFLAVFECLSVGTCGALEPFTSLGLVTALATPPAALVLYAASYRRLTRLAIEGRPIAARRGAPRGQRALAALARFSTRTPQAAGVCLFTLRTLARSRQHRMLLAGWLGVALALVISTTTATLIPYRPALLERPQPGILVAPLAVAILTLIAIRMVLAIPAEIKANWIFRLAQPEVLTDALSGAMAAMIIGGVLPSVVIAFLTAVPFWGVFVGMQHAMYIALLGIAVAQLLVRGLDKLPFTCTYYPGKAQIGRFWPLYLFAFSMVTALGALIEAALLRHRGSFLVAIAVLTAVVALQSRLRRREAALLPTLRFEEEALDAITLVNLM